MSVPVDVDSQSASKDDDDEVLESAAALHKKLTEKDRPVEYLTLCTVVSWALGRKNFVSSTSGTTALGSSSLLTVQQVDPEAQEKNLKKKEEMMAINIRRATIREYFNSLNDKPQLLLLQEVANMSEMEHIMKSADLEGWHASSSLTAKLASCVTAWSIDLGASFHVKERYGFRKDMSDKSLQEMFSLESIVAGCGDESKEVSKKLEEKRMVFVLLQVWGNRSEIHILIGIYNGPKKFSEARRVEVLTRFVQLAKQASLELSAGNLILAVDANIGLEKTTIIEQMEHVKKVATSIDKKLFEQAVVEGTNIVAWSSPNGSFGMEKLKCRKLERTIRKTMLKMNQDAQVDDDELQKYFAQQPLYLALKIRKEFSDESRKSIFVPKHRESDSAQLSEALAEILKQKQSKEKKTAEEADDHCDTD